MEKFIICTPETDSAYILMAIGFGALIWSLASTIRLFRRPHRSILLRLIFVLVCIAFLLFVRTHCLLRFLAFELNSREIVLLHAFPKNQIHIEYEKINSVNRELNRKGTFYSVLISTDIGTYTSRPIRIEVDDSLIRNLEQKISKMDDAPTKQ